MGRNSGGVNSNGRTQRSALSSGKTEVGYTAKMKKNILGIEQQYRNNADETLHVFNKSGQIIKTIAGKGAKVDYTGYKIPENSILTHNHPRSIGKSGIRSIGNTFSLADLQTAVGHNVEEIRAVTPRYTFSVKRPKGGWGVGADELRSAYASAEKTVRKEFNSYIDKRNYSQESIDRVESMHSHRVMGILSKQFGWNYTRKKG